MRLWQTPRLAVGRPVSPVGTWGAIHTRKRGARWVAKARYRDLDGVRRDVERTGATKTAAKTRLLEHLAERGGLPATAQAQARMAAVIAEWLELPEHNWAINTRRRYAEVARLHVIPGVGGLTARELTVPLVDHFLQGLSISTGAATARLARAVLRGALSHAVRHGVIAANPVREAATITVERKAPTTLSLDQVRALRGAFAARELPAASAGRPVMPGIAAMIDLMLGTGLRIGEAVALTWDDLDLDAGTVTVRSTAVRDEAGAWVRQGHAKTQSSHRTLQLPAFSIAALQRLSGQLPATDAGLAFPSAAGTVRDPGNVRKVWNRACAELGIAKGVTPHAIRRTVATMLDQELGIAAAAAQLGHADEGTARRHYVARLPVGPDAGALEVLGNE